MTLISKTDYLTYCECPKNAWIKIHKRDIFDTFPPTDFDKSIIEIGINVEEEYARKCFPDGVLIGGRDKAAQEKTRALIEAKTPVIFQAVFSTNGFLAAGDILKYDAENDVWDIYEVKATNSTKESGGRSHIDDITFQSIVLADAGLRINKCFIVHLNSEYILQGELNLRELFVYDDVTEKVGSKKEDMREKMEKAKAYLLQENEPTGYCSCIYKGRNGHCTTFSYSNPQIPEYSIHNLSRIGSSKAKLKELASREIWNIEDLPDNMEFSKNQQAQIDAYLHGAHIDTLGIRDELEQLAFPLYFLDYETFPAAIPRFDGYSPYQHIPFQFSLHKLESTDAELEHFEFLHIMSGDPNPPLIEHLKKTIAPHGSIIVWHKSFECSKNNEMAKRHPESAAFLAQVNDRIYDLEDIFTKQYYVKKEFKGKTSIKFVLPVLVPELSYKKLNIQNGQAAMEQWNLLGGGTIPAEERDEIAKNLKEYCKLDTYAMYVIWKKLHDLISK